MILALVGLIDAIDRGILPGAATKIKDALHFSDFKIGVLGTAFILASFLATPIAGYIVDRRRRTHIIGVVLAWWGVVSAVTATVQNFVQFFAVRAALGASDAVNSPASQSLVADYYPPAIRGRAYAVRQVTPILGTALGTGLGGVAGTFGWRWAFLLVGIPGSVLAWTVWRMVEPAPGEHDGDPAAAVGRDRHRRSRPASRPPPAGPTPWRPPRSRPAAITCGSEDRDRHPDAAGPHDRERRDHRQPHRPGLLGAVVLRAPRRAVHGPVGRPVSPAGSSWSAPWPGTIAGGVAADRLARRYEGAPMLLAGVAQFAGGVLLFSSFLHVPTWTVRVPLQFVGVLLIVGAIPALAAMTAEVAPARLRGTAFAVTTWMGALLGAVSAPLVGALADHWPITVHGKQEGNLALAFAIVTPLVLVGSVVVLNGRRHVSADTARARAGMAG